VRPNEALLQLMSLPFRIRQPLSRLRARAAPLESAGSDSQTEEMWTKQQRPDYSRLILTSKVYQHGNAVTTPLQEAPGISEKMGNRLLLKREDVQPTFSFKVRGAYNKLAHLVLSEAVEGGKHAAGSQGGTQGGSMLHRRHEATVVTNSLDGSRLAGERADRGGGGANGVIACGANHAIAVARAAHLLGVGATVVMPVYTPKSIRDIVSEQYGAQIVITGTTMADAAAECRARVARGGSGVLVPAFDDPHVIAGHGTVALEILNQTNIAELHAIFVCCGGGGLLAGVAAYVKHVAPHVKVVGVEGAGAEAMTLALQRGQPFEMSDLSTFAENAAFPMVGEETFRVCNDLVDDMVVVSNDEICAAIENTFEETRSMLEPAGALAVAGARHYAAANGLVGKNIVAITSGANVKFDRLRFVAERALVGERKEAMVAVRIPERPGAFKELYRYIYPRSVTEFVYRYSGDTVEPAAIFLSFELAIPGSDEATALTGALTAAGMPSDDISDNEMAKSHARYLFGGRLGGGSGSHGKGGSKARERVFRFEFPETPGALRRFLDRLPDAWNVSLFHYRNHGSDKGKVLVGLQLPDDSEDDFEQFVADLGYAYVEETHNSVYRNFMA